MTPKDVVSEIDSIESKVKTRLRSFQNEDGGFKAYYAHDTESGIWSTAGALSVLNDPKHPADYQQKSWAYLQRLQNADGGWGFRANGKSITDITAWTCLTLDPDQHCQELRRGLDFVLQARVNTIGLNESGWGLTSFEPDRIYSTWIAARCLRHLRTVPTCVARISDMDIALVESSEWIASGKNLDGSWGEADRNSRNTNTAVALLALFEAGYDPTAYERSFHYLTDQIHQGLWNSENEIIVTQEGYELGQVWFTSALCFCAMIHFAQRDVAPLQLVHETYESICSLARADGAVMLDRDSRSDLVWPLPYFIMAIRAYRALVRERGSSITRILAAKEQELFAEKKRQISESLQDRYPYPISHGYFTYKHELDHHRRFTLLLQLYEICIKFTAIVGLSGFLTNRETDPSIVSSIEQNFKRPTLGHWADLLIKLLHKSSGFTRLLVPHLPDDILKQRKMYLHPDRPRVSLGESLATIVHTRNNTSGHGAVRSQYEYKRMCEDEEDALFSFLDRLLFLSTANSFLVLASEFDEFGSGDRYHIRIFRGLNISDSQFETPNRLSEGQRDALVRYIYFQNLSSNFIVNLYPFLSYMYCDECKHERFFFFNGITETSTVAYLAYDCGHIVSRYNGEHFMRRLKASAISWR